MARLWIALLAAALLSTPALAYEFDGSQRLLLSEGTLRGSPRLMGISGAFVGIAEGAEGITRNPAAAANPDPHYEGDFTFDLGGTLHFLGTLPFLSLGDQDWDNDSRPDQAGGGPFSFIGAQVLYSALKLQYKKVALGVGFDLQNFVYQRFELNEEGVPFVSKAFTLGQLHIFGSLAAVFWEDQIAVGLGVESTHAYVAHLQDKSIKDTLFYHGWGIQFGGLWRPKHEDYRIGFAFRPQTVGRAGERLDERMPQDGGARGTFGGLLPFSEVVAPARISLGGSYAVGNGRAYNILSPDDWTEPTGELKPDGTAVKSSAMTKWLFSAQLDIFWPAANATLVSPWVEQGPGVDVLYAGQHLSFEPRIAVEKEFIPERLRFRAGGYLEPPMVSTRAPDGSLGPGRTRPHVTFGGEVRIYKKLTFGLSFDLAYAYMNLSVALYTWK